MQPTDLSRGKRASSPLWKSVLFSSLARMSILFISSSSMSLIRRSTPRDSSAPITAGAQRARGHGHSRALPQGTEPGNETARPPRDASAPELPTVLPLCPPGGLGGFGAISVPCTSPPWLCSPIPIVVPKVRSSE